MTVTAEAEPIADEPPTLSMVLASIGSRFTGARITLADFIDQLGGRRSFGAVLLVLGLFAWLPVWPPGVASIFGIGLICIALQMLLGRTQPSLPRRLLAFGLSTDRARRLAARALPWIQRLERYIRPRRVSLTGPDAQRWLAGLVVILAIVICVPLPMTNSPPGAAIVVLALGILAKDGMFIIAGICLAVLGLLVVAGFWASAWLGVSWALSQ